MLRFLHSQAYLLQDSEKPGGGLISWDSEPEPGVTCCAFDHAGNAPVAMANAARKNSRFNAVMAPRSWRIVATIDHSRQAARPHLFRPCQCRQGAPTRRFLPVFTPRQWIFDRSLL
jgi:hypothetical protein